jgi:hypothetical protein
MGWVRRQIVACGNKISGMTLDFFVNIHVPLFYLFTVSFYLFIVCFLKSLYLFGVGCVWWRWG